jgi:hypothetical protein
MSIAPSLARRRRSRVAPSSTRRGRSDRRDSSTVARRARRDRSSSSGARRRRDRIEVLRRLACRARVERRSAARAPACADVDAINRALFRVGVEIFEGAMSYG